MKDTNRIKTIDLARGISICLVIFVHTLWIYGSIEMQANSWVGHAIHFIGKGTPMFLIAMGFSFVLSSRTTISSAFKRGLYLLLAGYFMNFLKFAFPQFIGILPSNFIQAYGWSSPLSFQQYLHLILTGDILQLAGLTMFILGIVHRFIHQKYVVLGIAIAMMLCTKLVNGVETGISGLDYFFHLLWGSGWDVYFAVFPWASFILLGHFFGMWYKEKEGDQTFLFKRMALFALLFMLTGGALLYQNYTYHFGDYFHLGPGGAIYLGGFNLLLYSLTYLVVHKTADNKIFQFFYYASQHVTTIYVTQWVLICWGMYFFGFQKGNSMTVLLLIPVYCILTFSILNFKQLLFHQKSKKEKLA